MQLKERETEYIHDLLSYEKIKKMGFFNPDYIEKLVHQYSQPDFRLNLPYESDLLILVITLAIFLEEFQIQGLY